MEIIESWITYDECCYAIVHYNEKTRGAYKYGKHAYEALWLDDGELYSFAGSVGFRSATFETLEETQAFLLKGITEDNDPDIWYEMLAV